MSQTKEQYIEDLRDFVRDKEQFNRLLDFEEESSYGELEQAIEYALDDINSFPPVFSKDFSISEFPNKSLLLKGAAIWLLESAGILQSRNRLNYSDGGVTVQVSDKAGEYQAWIQNFSKKYYQKLRRFKVGMNMDRGWGGSSSDYDRGFS